MISKSKEIISNILVKELYLKDHLYDTFKIEVNCDMDSLHCDKLVRLGRDKDGYEYGLGLVGNDMVLFTNADMVYNPLVLDRGDGEYELNVLSLHSNLDSPNVLGALNKGSGWYCTKGFKCVDFSNCVLTDVRDCGSGNVGHMIYGRYNLSMEGAFYGLPSESVDLRYVDCSECENFEGAFSFSHAKKLDLGCLNMNKGKYFAGMFLDSEAEEIDFGGNSFDSVEDIGDIFTGCDDLKRVKISRVGWENWKKAEWFEHTNNWLLENEVEVVIV